MTLSAVRREGPDISTLFSVGRLGAHDSANPPGKLSEPLNESIAGVNPSHGLNMSQLSVLPIITPRLWDSLPSVSPRLLPMSTG